METKREGFLKSFEYHTDANKSASIFHKMTPRSKLYFVTKLLRIVNRGSRMAKQGKYDYKQWIHSSVEAVHLLENCGGKFHITGIENLVGAQGPFVFISNHMSTLETFVFPGIIAQFMDVTFVVKDSLVKHPLFGPLLRTREPIVVGRTDSRADFNQVMSEGQTHLSKGTSVVIFPQSTRMVALDPKQFNTLGVKLAKSAKVSVIPVAIKTDFWGNGKLIKEFGPLDASKPIYIEFGKPMPINGNGKEEHQQVVDFIAERLTAWGGQVLISSSAD